MDEPEPSRLGTVSLLAIEACGVIAWMVPMTMRKPARTHLVDCALVFGVFAVLAVLDAVAHAPDDGAPEPRDPRTSRTSREPDFSPGRVSITDRADRVAADLDGDRRISHGEAMRAQAGRAAKQAGALAAIMSVFFFLGFNRWIARVIPRFVLAAIAAVVVAGTVARAAHLTRTVTPEMKREIDRQHILDDVRRSKGGK